VRDIHQMLISTIETAFEHLLNTSQMIKNARYNDQECRFIFRDQRVSVHRSIPSLANFKNTRIFQEHILQIISVQINACGEICVTVTGKSQYV
jgi:hypothetical protein